MGSAGCDLAAHDRSALPPPQPTRCPTNRTLPGGTVLPRSNGANQAEQPADAARDSPNALYLSGGAAECTTARSRQHDHLLATAVHSSRCSTCGLLHLVWPQSSWQLCTFNHFSPVLHIEWPRLHSTTVATSLSACSSGGEGLNTQPPRRSDTPLPG